MLIKVLVLAFLWPFSRISMAFLWNFSRISMGTSTSPPKITNYIIILLYYYTIIITSTSPPGGAFEETVLINMLVLASWGHLGPPGASWGLGGGF